MVAAYQLTRGKSSEVEASLAQSRLLVVSSRDSCSLVAAPPFLHPRCTRFLGMERQFAASGEGRVEVGLAHQAASPTDHLRCHRPRKAPPKPRSTAS